MITSIVFSREDIDNVNEVTQIENFRHLKKLFGPILLLVSESERFTF